MPSRIVREGINSSPRVNRLSFGAELLYRRLMSVADDHGRFHASPVTIRGACWPICPERVTERQVAKWLEECQQGDRPLISLYEVDGGRYLALNDFGQQIRTRSKFPEPLSACEQPDNNLKSDCEQSAQPSRIRSRIAYTEGRPIQTSQAETENGSHSEIGEAAQRMYALHPQKKDMVLVPGALESAVGRGHSVSQIEDCHRAHTESDAWKEKGGRFVPRLAAWLSDDGFTKWPLGREPKKPINQPWRPYDPATLEGIEK